MKKANVNLFDKNKVQLKLLKNKNLRISDGRKHPTKVVNLKKTGITIWTDGKHLKIFRGDCLKEVIGRSVYRTNKFETVEFIGANNAFERRKIGGKKAANFVGANNVSEGLISGTKGTNFVGANNVSEGLIAGTKRANFVGANNVSEGLIAGTKGTNFVGANNVSEGLIGGTKGANFVGANNVSEGLISGKKAANFIGANNVSEGRLGMTEDVLVIGARDASEARSLKNGYAIYMGINGKSTIVRQGSI